jgi:hypothetical protein
MRLHRSTTIAMLVSGVGTVALLAPIAFGFLSIRSTPDSPGAEPAAYVIIGAAVLAAALLAAAIGGALVSLIRRLLRR